MNYFKQSLFKNILMTKIWLSGPPWGPRRARLGIFETLKFLEFMHNQIIGAIE